MKLRIESDGTANGTQVLTEDGQVVEGVKSVTWKCTAGKSPFSEAQIFLHRVPVHIVGEAGAVFAGEEK